VDRGPVALFGAIVAVGLGPALWLGAQFGTATAVPARPATVSGLFVTLRRYDKSAHIWMEQPK